MCLEQHDYQVEEAQNGSEAIDAITMNPPAIVLLDLSIPAPQGLEVLRRLKSMAVRPKPRIVVLTANGSIERAVEAIRLGAVDFLEKPCEPEHLLEVIERVLDEKVLAESAKVDGYDAIMERVRRYLADGNPTKTEVYLRAASHLAGTDPEYFHLLGLWHELNGRRDEARAAFQQAVRLDPRYPLAQDALRRLGAP
jgi:DNA-binding NtrC family response regulator